MRETTQPTKGAELFHSGLYHGTQTSLPDVTSALTFPCPGLRSHSDKMWPFYLGICCSPTQNLKKDYVDSVQIISYLVPACEGTPSMVAQLGLMQLNFWNIFSFAVCVIMQKASKQKSSLKPDIRVYHRNVCQRILRRKMKTYNPSFCLFPLSCAVSQCKKGESKAWKKRLGRTGHSNLGWHTPFLPSQERGNRPFTMQSDKISLYF